MDISLEKIDTIRERTGVSYREAKEALEKNNGDLVEALIYLEENQKHWGEDLTNKGDIILDKLKEAIKKGNVTKIVVKKDGEIIMNIPVTAGAIGALLSPPITAIGLTAALLSKAVVEIVKEDGEVVNLNDMAEKSMEKMKKSIKVDKRSDGSYYSNSDDIE